MRLFLLIVLTTCLVSCGSAVVDYDEGANFNAYSTYNYYPTIDSGLSELDNKRIIRAADSLLQLQGMTKSDRPQLYVNFYAKEIITNSRNTIGIGIGGGGRRGGVSVGGGIPIGGREVEQQFTLDFIDVMNDNLVWQGVLDARFKEKASPRQREMHYFKVLQKIVKKYPPKE